MELSKQKKVTWHNSKRRTKPHRHSCWETIAVAATIARFVSG